MPPPARVPEPPEEPPPPPPPVIRGPLQIRVGLATDLQRFELPCCNPQIKIENGAGDPWPLTTATTVTPGGELVERVVYRLQVAALKNDQQAAGIADYLRQETGLPADAVFDAGTDLYRVRVGRFESRATAEEARTRLESLGLAQSWIASEGGRIDAPTLRIRRGEETFELPGRWLDITAPTDVGIPYEGVRYRGRLLLYLNDRGRLNVINELPLEDYLRGVVPKEMGPLLYNRLEALKAQTVAARTYTLRNLGEFAEEGYDICSTPRCQVYGGMAVEHPRSDRAIKQTAGEVAMADGEPAETFYSSTCGGHTENVEVVFPLKTGTYLRGVPCVEAGSNPLEGTLRGGPDFPAGLMRQLLPPASGEETRVLSARLEHLAFLANLPTPRDRLRSLAAGEMRRFLASVFDLALDPRLFQLEGEALDRLLAEPSGDWDPQDLRFARYIATGPLRQDAGERSKSTLGADARETLLFELALELGVLRGERTHFLSRDGQTLEIRRGGAHQPLPLPASFATFRRQGQSFANRPLELMAGDRLDLYWRGDVLVALVQPQPPTPVDLSRHAKRQRWTADRSFDEVRAAVQARYPGFPFRDFEVVSRGVSGRVGKMRLLGDDGRDLVVEGLAVRWTLDVWDTLFTAQEQTHGHDPTGWTFHGRGWGHGVGMCQAGAYGMALRGSTYREILSHYYTGIELGRLQPTPPRPRPGTDLAP